MKLTLEQEFQLRVYQQQLMKLNQIQTQKHLIEVLKHMMLKDNFIKYLLRKAT
nr:phycytochrome bilisome degradation protein [Cyanidioschyzonaceae sp. 2]